MNRKLLNCFLVSCILSYCPYISQASDCIKRSKSAETLEGNNSMMDCVRKVNTRIQCECDNTTNSSGSNGSYEKNSAEKMVTNDVNKSQVSRYNRDSLNNTTTENNISNSITENNNFLLNTTKQSVKNCPKILYNPHIMWFDYQALFEKTKNIVSGKKDNREVKCDGFYNSELAKQIVLDNNYNSDALINNVLSGNIVSQYFVFTKCIDWLGENLQNGNNIVNDYGTRIVKLNCKFLVGILAALYEHRESIISEYERMIGDSMLKKMCHIENWRGINFCNIIQQISNCYK
ncbi:MAG: hypothetical protein IJ848_02350 [Alphaproteobacteria bacterium]|nr:hypothetical protein [Alphaproteobacteria bacterium]